MKRLLLFPVLLLWLVACSLPATPSATLLAPEMVASPMPTLTPLPVLKQASPASAGPDTDDPVQLMLYSHDHWATLWVDVVYVSYAGDIAQTVIDSTRTQLWLEQPNKARLLSGPAGGAPTRLWVSDGMNQQENGGAIAPLPPIAEGEFQPPALPADAVYMHPFGSMLGSVLGDFIFSTALAQRTGEYHLVGRETFVRRETLVLEYFRYPDGTVVDRLWIDAATGVILRYVNFGKPAGGVISVEIYATDVQFDGEMPEGAFIMGNGLPNSFASGVEDVGAQGP
jgi:hypothetical protein